MHTWAAMIPGTPVGPRSIRLGPEANERYWAAAGLDHPALRTGLAYPLVAANSTVLAWHEVCAEPVIQTRQHLVVHRGRTTPVELTGTGRVTERFERGGREYVTVVVEVADDRGPLWTSTVDFTPAATLTRRAEPRSTAARRRSLGADAPPAELDGVRRRLVLTDDAIRRYSRRGNYHSDAATASELGLPGLVAQGTQVCGPAIGLLLDAWGPVLLEHGTVDVRFVGVVLGGDEVEAVVAAVGDDARFEVHNRARGHRAAVGTATLARG